MLPKLINHSYTRSTRESSTNFPNKLSNLYNSCTPRHLGKFSSLPPINQIPTETISPSNKKQSHERRIKKFIETNKIKKEKIFKGKAAEMLWNNFNIFIKNKDLANESIESIMEKAYYLHKYRELNAKAKIIQNSWNNYRYAKVKKQIHNKREAAARLIQKNWKKYRDFNLKPRFRHEAQIKSAIIIQKHFRGYLCRMKYSVIAGRQFFEKNMRYFDEVRSEIMNESALVILKYWKKYKVIFTQAKKNEIIEKAKILAKAKNTGSALRKKKTIRYSIYN